MDDQDLKARAIRDVQPLVELLKHILNVRDADLESLSVAMRDAWRQGYMFAHEENTVRTRAVSQSFPKPSL